MERLLSVHPDASRLHALERRMARANREWKPLGPHPLRAPGAIELETPGPVASAPPPPTSVNRERAVAAIREDFALRREARPTREEEAYRRALGRLRRRFLEFRREPLPPDSSNDLAQAQRYARRYSELEEQLRSLRERPDDRLFYTPAQLRRRRELYHLTEQELEALRVAEVARLENAMSPKGQPLRNAEGTEREIPPAEVEKAEQERDQLRREALEELARLERAELQRVDETQLPAPVIQPVQPASSAPESEEIGKERTALEEQVRTASGPPSAGPRATGAPGSIAALGRERDELRLRLIDEVRAAAAAATRAQRIVLTFDRGKAPDRTREIRQAVAKLLAGRSRQGERIHEQRR